METSTRRGADLVRQMLLFARGRQGDFERLDVRPLVEEMEKPARDTFPQSITVSAHVTDAEARAISDARPGPFVVLIASDTGAGIPPDALSEIFEPSGAFFNQRPPRPAIMLQGRRFLGCGCEFSRCWFFSSDFLPGAGGAENSFGSIADPRLIAAAPGGLVAG